jgi:hypothetical protein
MAKAQIGYTETDQKEQFAKYFTPDFSSLPDAVKQALDTPVAWSALPDIDHFDRTETRRVYACRNRLFGP